MPTELPAPRSRPAAYLLTLAALAAVYYLAARLGLRYASIAQSISLVWPPTGIALAALVALGPRYWPGVALGAFLANVATPVPPAAAAGIALGNTLEALVAAWLVRRALGARPRLDTLRGVRTLILEAAPLGAVISAVVGVSSLAAAGVLPLARIAAAMAVWWTGDLLGALIVAPPLFAWVLARPSRESARGPLEITLLCLGTALAAELAVGRFVSVSMLRQVDYLYLLFPFVIWAALRFGSRGASLMTLTVAVVAVSHTSHGGGPFIAATTGGTLFASACYLAAVAVTGLTLAAAVAHERAQATATLQQRDDQLRVALDAARMGIWSWSAAENRLVWDDTVRQLYGLAPGDTVAGYEDFLSRVHPDDRATVDQTVRRALADGGRLDYEFRIALPDGRVRWIADQGRVVSGPDGRPAGMTGACHDVTDRRTAEEQLRLAHRMESVGRLAGGVAHEANNQMSVVIVASEFVLGRPDIPPAVRADVESIRSAAQRTAAVTAQLLAFSRRQVLKPQVLDLNGALERFLPVLRRVMGEDCTVRLLPGPGVGKVVADPGQLEQVLLNLAINARDAMPRGGTLTVESAAVELTERTAGLRHGVAVRPGHYAQLAVTDTGHGIDRATLTHIFEPFFTTKGIGQGTGLGLATVYGIVKQSEGYVWAYSEPGHGTTLKVYLPITGQPVVPPEPGERPPGGTGELILVVEDEGQVRQIAARALAEAGYRVLQADGGQRALELVSHTADRIGLVLTDVVMPVMSGPELAAALAELRPDMPILFTSGYTDGEIFRRGLLAPGAAFLPKPFTAESLVLAVRERMDAFAAERRGASSTPSG